MLARPGAIGQGSLKVREQMVNVEKKGLLVLFEPGKAERLIEVSEKPITIGRSRHNDVTLQYNGVSKRHATIRCTPTGWLVADLGSTNGTELNGKRLPAHKPDISRTQLP